MRVAVTCLQLIRDIDQWREHFVAAGVDVVVADVPGQHLESDRLVAALHDCDAVVAGDDRFTRPVLEQLPALRVISKWGVGIDGIDRDAAAERGVLVLNTPGMFADEVADVSMAYVVMLARHLVSIDRGVRAGNWPKPVGTSLRAQTLGVVGFGAIGQAVAVRAMVAGMRVVATDPDSGAGAAALEMGGQLVGFEDLLEQSDFISINCPLTSATFHLFDEQAFARCKRGVRLVNTGRGAVVKISALVEALRTGHVSAAALDVMDPEPPPADHPLLSLESVVFGSHNASNTDQASRRTHEQAIQNLLGALRRTAT